MHKSVAIALVTAAAFSGLSCAIAQTPTPRQEIRQDTREIRQDRKEIREDKAKLRQAVKAGDKEGATAARKELREDRKELREDKRERREHVRAAKQTAKK
ncbi:MAG: hypothetical protein EXR28_07535 [Betaproteobacteria bacterium]|nr:hypothetical protein [Betaproteobacteria bacterium]